MIYLKKYVVLPVMAFATFTFLSSCGGGGKEEEQVDEEVTNDTLSTNVRTNINLIRVSIPSPLEVTKLISKAGYSYNKSVCNSAGKSSSYSTKFQAAANLGVYGADLGYVAGFNQTQDILEYVGQISKLAKTVGVESAFDQEFGKTLNGSIGKEDSLAAIIDEAYAKAERNLRSNERVSTASVIIAGGWIEGLYVSSTVVVSKPKDSKNAELYHQIYNHVYAFSYVLDLLKEYKKDQDCAKMYEEIKSIEPILSAYSKQPKLGQDEATRIKDAITTVRNKIVN